MRGDAVIQMPSAAQVGAASTAALADEITRAELAEAQALTDAQTYADDVGATATDDAADYTDAQIAAEAATRAAADTALSAVATATTAGLESAADKAAWNQLLLGTITIPASPTYYVASTGNDGATHTGAIGDPLATVQEACRRLGITGWAGSAIVIVKDVLAMGTDPEISYPSPTGGAEPICIRGTLVDSGLGTITPTGGTAGTQVTALALATITTSLTPTLNQHKGKIAEFSGGVLINERRMIDANDVSGTFQLSGLITAGTPGATTPFTIKDYAGALSWTGILKFVGGPLCLDVLELRIHDCVRFVGSIVQDTGNRWKATTNSRIETTMGARIMSAQISSYTATTAKYFNPTGTVPCGSRYDGSAGFLQLGRFSFGFLMGLRAASFEHVNLNTTDHTLPNGFGFDSLSSARSCAFAMSEGKMRFSNCILDGCGAEAGGTAAIVGGSGADVETNQVLVQNTPAGCNILQLGAGARFFGATIFGLNPLASTPIIVGTLAQADFISGSTVTGATPGGDISIDGRTAISWATLAASPYSGLARSYAFGTTENLPCAGNDTRLNSELNVANPTIGDGTGQTNFKGGAWIAAIQYASHTTYNQLVTDYLIEITDTSANVIVQLIASGSTSAKHTPIIIKERSYASAYGVALAHTITIKPTSGKKLDNVVDATKVILNGGGVYSVYEDESGNFHTLGFTA
jgi:hypothetical protein